MKISNYPYIHKILYLTCFSQLYIAGLLSVAMSPNMDTGCRLIRNDEGVRPTKEFIPVREFYWRRIPLDLGVYFQWQTECVWRQGVDKVKTTLQRMTKSVNNNLKGFSREELGQDHQDNDFVCFQHFIPPQMLITLIWIKTFNSYPLDCISCGTILLTHWTAYRVARYSYT